MGKEFKQQILIDRASIIRVMERALLDRIEPVPRMNERVVMEIASEFRNHQYDAQKHLNWEANYFHTQRLYDPVGEIVRADRLSHKLNNRLGKPRVGGTVRFYFT